MLAFEGVSKEYACTKSLVSNQSLSVVGQIPDNICTVLINKFLGSSACGYNSYCMANGGFSFIDPNNNYGRCAPDFPVDCGVDNKASNSENLYDMMNVKTLISHAEIMKVWEYRI